MRRLLFACTLVVCLGQPAGEKAVTILATLKAANLFPQSSRITDRTALLTATDTDKSDGAISAAIIETSQPSGLSAVVYASSTQRNRARLRMIKDCPGCSCITQCGAILMYERYSRAEDLNKIMRGRSDEYRQALVKMYRCD